MAHKKIYIIADLHLSLRNENMYKLFKQFLESITSTQNTLYILGDFFDYWIGDDHTDAFYHEIATSLKTATDNSLEILFMHGNRDFLVSRKFAKQTGVKIINDPYYITVGNNKIVLAHGDRMCTDDKSYLFYRSLARNCILQFLFRRLPLFIRQRLANTARSHSYEKNTQKPYIDVTQLGIDRYRKDCNIVIHGHTHKMNIHQESDYTRYVLGDWFKKGNYIEIDGDEIILHRDIIF